MAIDPITAIGAVGSLGSGIANLFSQGQQQNNQAAQLQLALLNYQLQQKQIQQQYELATAGRTDARGNRTSYIPGYGWKTEVTPETSDAIKGSDAVQRQRIIELLTTNEDERGMARDRRLTEGSASAPLLDQIRFGYGAPTKEGVTGANKIAGVTGINENADNAKSAFQIQAMRSGGNVNPTTFSNIDRGATTGVRKALADVDAGAGPMYDSHMSSWMSGKLQPYNTLATRASNVENIPFAPETQSGNIDASMANAAAVGATRGTAGASEALYKGAVPLATAYGTQRGPNYDTFIGGVTENLKNLLRGNGKKDDYVINNWRSPYGGPDAARWD